MEVKKKKIMFRDDNNDGVPEVLEVYKTISEGELTQDKVEKIEVFDMGETLAEIWNRCFN